MAIQVTRRERRLIEDENGYTVWQMDEKAVDLAAEQSALLLCDVWDQHWCRGAEERQEKLIPRINETINAAREKGLLIVHAPSDTMEFYQDNPARRRVLEAPPVEPPEPLPHDDPRSRSTPPTAAAIPTGPSRWSTTSLGPVSIRPS